VFARRGHALAMTRRAVPAAAHLHDAVARIAQALKTQHSAAGPGGAD